MTGRPTTYTEETADLICELLAQGKSLVKVCQELEIGYTTVRQWLRAHEDFALKYASAREDQADFLADDILDIADDTTATPDDRRIRIDVRKWYAGKLKPKKYGDKTIHTGADGEAPAVFTLSIDRRDKDG